MTTKHTNYEMYWTNIM